MIDLSDVSFVKRIVVGTTDPAEPISEADNEAQIQLLNRCLHEQPRGRIVAIEKSLTPVKTDGHTEFVQAVIYHVGFARRPVWMEG